MDFLNETQPMYHHSMYQNQNSFAPNALASFYLSSGHQYQASPYASPQLSPPSIHQVEAGLTYTDSISSQNSSLNISQGNKQSLISTQVS